MQTRIRKANAISFVLFLVWIYSLFIPPIVSGNGWFSFILCQLFHANLLHLLANLFVLYNTYFSWREFVIAFLIGATAMLAATEPTLGISASIYAILAFRMMDTHQTFRTWVTFIAVNGVTAFIPHIAFRVHMAAFVMGLVFTLFHRLAKRYNEYRRIVERR